MSEDKRKDDSFYRKVAATIASFIIAQGLVGLYYVGSLSTKVEILLEQQINLTQTVFEIAREQARRTVVIEDARKHFHIHK